MAFLLMLFAFVSAFCLSPSKTLLFNFGLLVIAMIFSGLAVVIKLHEH